jgi:hypothetical protein
MASLTTVDGYQYYFDPNGVVAISDHDPSTGQLLTCVYGISASGYLRIGGTLQNFLASLGTAAAKFGQVTRADGAALWVNGAAVTSVRSCASTDGVGANAVIFAAGTNYAVQETAAAAAHALTIPA